jgi:sialate O-acetylesterase
VRRDVLASDPRYAELLERWAETESTYDHKAETAKYEARLAKWKESESSAPRPRPPRNPLIGQHRPANLYNGVLNPILGYGIRGAIWYQGESNAGRAYQYRHLFPLMIQLWRDEWKQGDFPFYWVQLADFQQQSEQPQDSAWAELREAQTMTMSKLANTGEAVIIDLGEAKDIHPRNKQDVAQRLARWALVYDYGVDDIVHRSPLYKSMEKNGNRILLTFDVGKVGNGALTTFDVKEVKGFAIAGENREFVWAQAEIKGRDQVEVWSDDVDDPVAVRYAWANNPVCNLTNRAGLPATPFRTDDWPGVTADAHK